MVRFWSTAFLALVFGALSSGVCLAAPNRSYDDLNAAAIVISDHTFATFAKARAIAEEAGARGLQMFPPDAIFGYFPARPEPSLFEDLPVALCHAQAELAERDVDPIVAAVVGALFNEKTILMNAAADLEETSIDDRVLRVPEDIIRATTPAGPRRGSPREMTERGISQNSEFLIGSVLLNIIFPESPGNGENWTDQEIADALVAVSLGLSQYMQKALWVDLSFTYNYRNFKRVPVSIEPITSNMSTDDIWVGDAISYLGYDGGALFGTHQLNNHARDSLKTDWAYTAYIVDMSNRYDPNPPSPDPGCWGGAGYVAYSYLGGPYMVIPYPACRYGSGLGFGRVFIHEMSHGFWVLDEYASAEVSCSERSGYLSVPTRNTLWFSCQETVPCIMQTARPPFSEPQPICEYTMGQAGLADENDNSVPDIYDVPPEIEFMSFPGIEMDTLLPDDQYVLSIRIWNDAVPNSNPKQNPGTRIDYAATIKSGEISFNGAPFVAIKPSDGAWDGASEVLAYEMADPLDPGLNTITMLVKNRVELAAQVEKKVFVIGLKYYYVSAAARDSIIHLAWTTAGEVFGAVFDVLRADITTGEGWKRIASVSIPDETSVNRKAYSYRDELVEPGHEYRYRILGRFGINLRGEHHEYEFSSKEVSETATIPVGKLVSYLLPNPTSKSTSFTISIPKTFRDMSGSREPSKSRGFLKAPSSIEVKTDVDVAIYNILGQRIKTVYSNSRFGGSMTRSWNGVDSNGRLVPSGVYFLSVRAGGLKETKKIIIVR